MNIHVLMKRWTFFNKQKFMIMNIHVLMKRWTFFIKQKLMIMNIQKMYIFNQKHI